MVGKVENLHVSCVYEVRTRRLTMKYKMSDKRNHVYLESYLRTTQVHRVSVKKLPDVLVDVIAVFTILCSLLVISSIV